MFSVDRMRRSNRCLSTAICIQGERLSSYGQRYTVTQPSNRTPRRCRETGNILCTEKHPVDFDDRCCPDMEQLVLDVGGRHWSDAPTTWMSSIRGYVARNRLWWAWFRAVRSERRSFECRCSRYLILPWRTSHRLCDVENRLLSVRIVVWAIARWHRYTKSIHSNVE